MKKWLVVGIILMFFASAFSGFSKETTDTSVILSSRKVTPDIHDTSFQLPRSWQQINEDGFGDKHNVGTRAMSMLDIFVSG
jgi:hypothetical protein